MPMRSIAAGVRRDLSGRDRRSGGARPRLGVGADPPDPSALRPVREPAADAAAAGRAGARSPGATAADIDMICVRENSEGEYAGVGGRLHAGTPHEVAEQTSVFTRRGVERIARFAFEVASRRPRRSCSPARRSRTPCSTRWCCGTKRWSPSPQATRRSSGASITSTRSRRAWSPIRRASTSSSPRTCSATSSPTLARPCQAASASPRRQHQSGAAAPVHVRADSRLGARYRGTGIANPIGAIWAGAMMLDHLGPDRRARSHRRGHRAGGRARWPEDAGPGRHGDDQGRGRRRCGRDELNVDWVNWVWRNSRISAGF